ncbi:ribosome biogenesis protein Nop16 [Aspergillus granulosus]|uniref:Nucleolar protein 16 n=1 Tax=Aspergillus granulosus TaxID=176169 RepID=A0ABR4GX28_9EURO
MGNIRQARKNRSSAPKQKPKRTGILKSGKKKINVLGNAIIAENWDRKLTLTQNYRRLGLVHRLNAPSGGSEKRKTQNGFEEPEDSLHIKGSVGAVVKNVAVSETKVERDPETGKIIRVVHPDEEEIEIAGRKHRRANPLDDPLNDLSDEDDDSTPQVNKSISHIVQQLELQANKESQAAKKPRHQSAQEQSWIARLVERHGDNYAAMARDMKFNPMQQTAGDLRRRIEKWKKTQA